MESTVNKHARRLGTQRRLQNHITRPYLFPWRDFSGEKEEKRMLREFVANVEASLRRTGLIKE